MSGGWYKRRRGILEHIESGKISILEAGIHDYLSLKANLVIGSPCALPVGVCFTNAAEIHAHCPEVSERTIRRSIARLERLGWTKTWKIQGQRGRYPVLLARSSVHDGAGKEFRINAAKTTDWRHPAYEPCRERAVSSPSSVREEASKTLDLSVSTNVNTSINAGDLREQTDRLSVTEPAGREVRREKKSVRTSFAFAKEEKEEKSTSSGAGHDFKSMSDESRTSAPFFLFWKAYPKKEQRRRAKAIWKKKVSTPNSSGF